MPLSIKTGLISNIQIQFSVLSFWSSPLELEIQDLFVLVGPSKFFKSNNESYIEEAREDLLNCSYDSTNAFNVFDHEMKIKSNGTMGPESAAGMGVGLSAEESYMKQMDNLRALSETDWLKEKLKEEEQQVQNVRLIFKNIKINI